MIFAPAPETFHHDAITAAHVIGGGIIWRWQSSEM